VGQTDLAALPHGRQVFYDGHVQGVGFRYTARSIAGRFAVTGFVRNLPDGRVELVIEGQASAVEAFLEEVQTTLGRHIRHIDDRQVTPMGQFSSFDVRH
jgi:acylphosphatase